jgi:hypothetical protein
MSGLFGSSQNTNTQFQKQDNSTQQQNQQYQNSSAGTNQSNYTDPLMGVFSQSLIPAFGKAYQDAQAPVYGTSQIAQNEQNANQTFNTGLDSATQALARRGALDSGATTSVASSLGAARAGNIANFDASVPLLNQQARTAATDQLLGLSSQFLNTAPKTSTTAGSNSGTGQQTGVASDTSTGQQNTNVSSNPSILSDIGGIAGLLSGIPGLSGMLNGIFGGGGGMNIPFDNSVAGNGGSGDGSPNWDPNTLVGG